MPKALLSVLLAVVFLILSVEVFSSLRKPNFSITARRYLVLRRALLAGHPVALSDFTYRPEGEWSRSLREGTLTDQDLHLLKGAAVREAQARGSTLTLEDLILSPAVSGLGAAVPRGLRAYRLEAEGMPQLRYRDRVDIFRRPGKPEQFPELLAEAVLVLQSMVESHWVLVAVSRAQMDQLEKARHHGALGVVLRNPEEFQLSPKIGSPKRNSRIEVWED